ncbi:MAG: ABC transporter permease [Gemmatimonadota bacterium]|nr:ABC transporter permease [Gemmatimonadota bacterium]
MIGWLRRRRLESTIDEEIRTHLEMAIRERMARGASREEAEMAARREFGNVGRVKDATRRVWGGLWFDGVVQDIRFALRQFRRSPGFTLTAFTTIAVSIGLTTSVFTLVNALLFSSLPGVHAPDELVALYTSESGDPGVSSYMDYRDFVVSAESFSDLTAFKAREVDVTTASGTSRLEGLMVSESYFRTLGIAPAAGRFFLPEEDEAPGRDAVAVLSYDTWQTAFGGDESAIGATITLNRRAFTIVGVAPPRFRGTNLVTAPDIYVPMAMQPHLMPSSGLLLHRRGWGGIDVLGRLAPGVTIDRAQAEVDLIGERLVSEYPSTNTGREYSLEDFRDATMPFGMRSRLLGFGWILMALVMLVLLVACVNVANLLLTRGHSRRGEVAVRQSLGATQGRLLRQLVTETGVLALVGGAAGLAIAVATRGLFTSLPLPFSLDFVIDRNVLVFATVATGFTGLAFGLAPAIGAARRDVVAALRTAAPGRLRGGRPSVADTLVVVQVALSVAVLAAAGLFGRTLANLRLVDRGFEPEGVLTAQLDPSLQGYEGERIKRFYLDVLASVRALPDTRAAALTSRLPGSGSDGTSISIEGSAPADGQRLSMGFSIVSNDYFETMEIPTRAGRAFSEQDREGAAPAIVLNEAAAAWLRDLTGGDGLATRISIEGPGGPFMQVVGVVADIRSGSPREAARPHMYFSFEQIPGGQGFARMAVLARGGGEPERLATGVRGSIEAVDRTVPVIDVRPLESLLGDIVAQERLATSVLAVAATLAVLLAALGLYGVLAHAVARRTSEIGVRLALGAARGSVMRGVLGRAMALTGVGLAVGLVLALVSGRALSSLLYGVSARDLGTLIVVSVVLLAVALLAAWLPARHAMRVDPVIALRAE